MTTTKMRRPRPDAMSQVATIRIADAPLAFANAKVDVKSCIKRHESPRLSPFDNTRHAGSAGLGRHHHPFRHRLEGASRAWRLLSGAGGRALCQARPGGEDHP